MNAAICPRTAARANASRGTHPTATARPRQPPRKSTPWAGPTPWLSPRGHAWGRPGHAPGRGWGASIHPEGCPGN
eukprot:6707558-Lingulodinium_polyedra.AAC.1